MDPPLDCAAPMQSSVLERPSVSIPGLAAAKQFTHIEALELDGVSEHLIVIGGGLRLRIQIAELAWTALTSPLLIFFFHHSEA